MSLLVLGTNHTIADIDVREKLAFGDSQAGKALREIVALPHIAEAALLSTCNRTEIYVVERAGAVDTEERIIDFLAERHGIARRIFEKHLYRHHDAAAASHLFSVAAGLGSMILGEPDIQRQVKSALLTMQSAGTGGTVLNRMFQDALIAGKRARTETGIARGSLSVGAVAVERATQIFGESLAGRTVLILGAGKMSEVTAKHLHSHGVASVIVTNRTYDKAVELARKFDGEARRFDELPTALATADIVVTSTAAPHPIITRPLIKEAMRARGNRELFLIDIAVPRDVDPAVGDLENVYLYNVDDLNQLVAHARRTRCAEIAHARELIDEAVVDFIRWLRSLEVAPLIAGVRERLADVRYGELQRLRGKLTGVSEADWRSIEAAMEAVTNKVAHGAIRALKQSAHDGVEPNAADTIRRTFGVTDEVRPNAIPRTAAPASIPLISPEPVAT